MASDKAESFEETAKKLFIAYNGSHYLMARDEFFGAYRMCKVSREKEVEWAKEQIAMLMPHFIANLVHDDRFSRLYLFIEAVRDYEILGQLAKVMTENIDKLDTFSTIRFVETLGRILEAFEANQHLLVDPARKCVEAMRLLVDYANKSPITVHPYYQTIPYLTTIRREEDLIKRMKRATSLVKNWERSLRPRQNG